MRLPAPRTPWYLHPLHAWQRHRHGRVLAPTQLWSHRPRALIRFLQMFGALRRRDSPVAAEVRSLVAVRVSQLTGCAFCIDLNASLLAGHGASDEKLAAVADWRASLLFSTAERAALAYADAMTATPPAVDDAVFNALQAHFAPPAIVELTAVIAFQNMSARFNTALQAEAYGFCRMPLPPTAAR
jgi:uncharacterized peroxidase-related enzyme